VRVRKEINRKEVNAGEIRALWSTIFNWTEPNQKDSCTSASVSCPTFTSSRLGVKLEPRWVKPHRYRLSGESAAKRKHPGLRAKDLK
jgi:hypothetical protein